LKELKKSRDKKGRWGRFNFYYTVSALIEMEISEAFKELKYAEASLSRSLKKYSNSEDIIGRRRKFVIETALNQI
jgi:hypothetical protein